MRAALRSFGRLGMQGAVVTCMGDTNRLELAWRVGHANVRRSKTTHVRIPWRKGGTIAGLHPLACWPCWALLAMPLACFFRGFLACKRGLGKRPNWPLEKGPMGLDLGHRPDKSKITTTTKTTITIRHKN